MISAGLMQHNLLYLEMGGQILGLIKNHFEP